MTADAALSISAYLEKAEHGDIPAADALFSALYAELHRLAKRELSRRGTNLTLSATTLLHEAYLDIASRCGPSFTNEGRFMVYAARVMRGLIIDHVRRRCALKRGGQFEFTRVQIPAVDLSIHEEELSPISDALDDLAKTEPELAQVVDLKFFCGLSFTVSSSVARQ